MERLRENLDDFNEKLSKNLYQDRLDGLITGHVLVQISRFLKRFSAKSAKFSRNRSSVKGVGFEDLDSGSRHEALGTRGFGRAWGGWFNTV